MDDFDIRAILILLAAVILALALQTAVFASTCIDQSPILADDTEKEETDKKSSGDAEPECE